MTLPNRINYTPGEKRRERKFQTLDGAMMTSGKASPTETPEMEGKSTSPTGSDDEALRQELLEVLSGMAPNGAEMPQLRGPQARNLDQHVQRLAKYKAHAEAARQRLHADQCLQQLPVKDEITSFSNMMDGGYARAAAESDPLEQLLTGMAADTGLSSSNNVVNRGSKMNHCLDPQWASLFQQTGPERQQLLSGLGKLEPHNAGSLPDLTAAMDMLQDAPLRNKYQRTMGSLHDWGKNRLYQQLRASMLSRGIPVGMRSMPTSPMESPLRQPQKKRANLSKHAKNILHIWFEEHMHHPYPTEEEKDWLSAQGGITIEQVNNWFINTRGRKWKPMLKRIIKDKETSGESALFDRLVEKIEEPYHHTSN